MGAMDHTANLRRDRGFTLVELMTVSFILAMIMGAIMATFTIGNRSMALADKRIDINQTAHLILSRLQQELSSLWVPFPEPDSSETLSVLGDTLGSGTEASAGTTATGLAATEREETPPLYGSSGDVAKSESARIEFLTAMPPQFGTERQRVDVGLITYYLDVDPQTPEQGLIRGVNRYVDVAKPEETTEFEVLSEYVTALEFQDYNPETQEFEDTWESQTLPGAILFSLTFDDEEDNEAPLTLVGTVTPPRLIGGVVGEGFTGGQETGTQEPTETVEQPGTGVGQQELEQLMGAISGGAGQ